MQRTKSRDYFGFLLASLAYTLLFSSSSAPTPLFAIYQEIHGFSNSIISFGMGAYLLGVVVTLLFIGRIAQAIGYRPAIIFGLSCSILGCVIFLLLSNPFMLFLGRFVQGISCGIGMSAVSAYIIDATAPYHPGWGAVVSGTFSSMGVMIGCLPAGILYQAAGSDWPMYFLIIAIFMLLIIGFLFAPELMEERTTLASTIKPRFSFPRSAFLLFALASWGYILTWSVCNFFQSFSGQLALVYLGTDSTMIAGIILACATALSFLGGPIANRMKPLISLIVGAACFVVSVICMALSLALGSLPLLLIFCTAFAIAMGICTTGGLRLMLDAAPNAQTTDTVSALNMVAYAGNAVFSFAISALVIKCSLILLLGMFAVFGASLLAWACLQKPASKLAQAA